MTDLTSELPTIERLTRHTAPAMSRLVLDSLFERNPVRLGVTVQAPGSRHLGKIAARAGSNGDLRLDPAVAELLGIRTIDTGYGARLDFERHARTRGGLAVRATEHAALAGITDFLTAGEVPTEVEDPDRARELVVQIRREIGEAIA